MCVRVDEARNEREPGAVDQLVVCLRLDIRPEVRELSVLAAQPNRISVERRSRHRQRHH
jgi:hypothetical protein